MSGRGCNWRDWLLSERNLELFVCSYRIFFPPTTSLKFDNHLDRNGIYAVTLMLIGLISRVISHSKERELY